MQMNEVTHIPEQTISGKGALAVRELSGQYREATPEEVIAAAQSIIKRRFKRGRSLTSPALVREFLVAKLACLEYEMFGVIFLNSRNCLIEFAEMFHGTINETSVYPREVVKLALKHNAAAVILTHNHPSGSPEPSTADIRMTAILKSALELVGTRVIDHIIVCGANSTSMTDRGLV